MLSVIIPIGGDDKFGYRRKNIVEELHCIRRQKYRDYELILVEEIFDKPLYDDLDVDKYIPVKAKRHFNLPWGRNVGARSATGKRLLHLDGDLLFDDEYFGKVARFDKKAFAAWSTIYRLSKKGAKTWLKSRNFKGLLKDKSLVDPREGRPTRPNIRAAAGVAYGFDRDFFFKRFGGFNENFFGWGGDDNDAALRFSRLAGGYYILPNCTIFHLPHHGRRAAGGGKEWGRSSKKPDLVTKSILKAGVGRLEGPTSIKY